MSGALAAAASLGASIQASASPTFSGASGSTINHTFSNVFTATPIGGSGFYTYAWSKVSDDGNGTWGIVTGGTSATVTLLVGAVASGTSATAVYQCVVTDSGTGATATTNTASATYNRI